LELTSNEPVKQAVIAGLGLLIMPLKLVQNELLKGGQMQILERRLLPIKIGGGRLIIG